MRGSIKAFISLTTGIILVVGIFGLGLQIRAAKAESNWALQWSDEFNGPANTGLDTSQWIYDIGTSYPGGPANWGNGEVQTYTNSTANVYQDGAGHLVIEPIHQGKAPLLGWTSGHIETQRLDFAAPVGGAMAVEASIQQPDVSGKAAKGYWPAFWMLGEAFRGNYWGTGPALARLTLWRISTARAWCLRHCIAAPARAVLATRRPASVAGRTPAPAARPGSTSIGWNTTAASPPKNSVGTWTVCNITW
jgi:hypothetical protein